MRSLLFLATVLIAAGAYASAFKGGKQVPLKDISEIASIAMAIDDSQGWCTPAMQVGPRVFITAAHCLPIFKQKTSVQIVGNNINKQLPFSFFSLGEGLTDETTFNAPECRELISGLPDGSELTLEQMRLCWANGGQADLALLVVDEKVGGQYLSVSRQINSVGDDLVLLGYTPDCGGDPRFYRAASFITYGFNNFQIVLSGAGKGITDHDSSACGGDSGGGYLRLSKGSVELVAIHSGGTKEGSLELSIHGKKVFVPKYFSAGTDLTNIEVHKWLGLVAEKNKLEICGVNLSCQKLLKLP